MLTNSTKYAIRATLYLALNSSFNQKVSAKRLAKDLNAPTAYLAKILQQLTKSRLISSTKGPNGGFYLSELNFRKTIWDVINCIDGTEQFDECFLGLPTCDNVHPCWIHELVTVFRSKLRKQFEDKNIKQLVQVLKEGKDRVQFDFYYKK